LMWKVEVLTDDKIISLDKHVMWWAVYFLIILFPYTQYTIH